MPEVATQLAGFARKPMPDVSKAKNTDSRLALYQTVQLTTLPTAALKRGDVLWARFFLRCTASLQESGEGRLTLVF